MTSTEPNLQSNHCSPVKDPAIVAYQRATTTESKGAPRALRGQGSKARPVADCAGDFATNGKRETFQQHVMSINNNATSAVARERGFIEKMLHSYGFIQCADRECRLFFHFSELPAHEGPHAYCVGDMVEFQQGLDRRSNKPIALAISRISVDVGSPGNTNCEIISDKPVIGKVLVVPQSLMGDSNGRGCNQGQVTYEQSGETFFLSFAAEDVILTEQLTRGCIVEFHICTDERNGNLRAKRVKRVSDSCAPVSPEVYSGVVCALKDSYGFIERADVVREIFFHFSEFQGKDPPQLGDDVSFKIQTRNNKEVAVNITLLPHGSVVFEDIGLDKKRGKILKLFKPNKLPSDPLNGKIVYETLKGPIEITYGERDEVGEYSLLVGDIVDFYIATDRRDQLKRATNISLVDITFTISNEKREQGFLIAVKESHGYIRCTERDAKLFFNITELINQTKEPHVHDEVEFTVAQDDGNGGRLIATRIKYLPRGTISEEQSVSERVYEGTIEKEAGWCIVPANQGNPDKRASGNFDVTSLTSDPDPGIIMYDVNGTKQTIPYSIRSVIGVAPKISEVVEFRISENLKNNTKTAIKVSTRVFSEIKPKLTRPSDIKSDGSSKGLAATSKREQTVAAKVCKSGTVGSQSSHSIKSPISCDLVKSSSTNSSKSAVAAAKVSSSKSNSRVVQNSNKSNSSNAGPAVHHDQGQEPTGKTLNGSAGAATTIKRSVSGGSEIPSTSEDKVGGIHNLVGTAEFGFVATLKDTYGFIELTNQDKEVFFHYSNFDGNPDELDIGDEVEFVFTEKGGKISAENVRLLPAGTIPFQDIQPMIVEGKVIRGLRITSPEQTEYCGLIETLDHSKSNGCSLDQSKSSGGILDQSKSSGGGEGCDGKSGTVYTYGVMSLIDRRELPQKGDLVRFQICKSVDGQNRNRAARVLLVRRLVHAKVEEIKEKIGVLSYESEDGRRLTFALADVLDGEKASNKAVSGDNEEMSPRSRGDNSELCVGDDVEFAVVRKSHSGRLIAQCVRRVCERVRPERLCRIKSQVNGNGEEPRLVTIRAPRGPDGGKGFKPRIHANKQISIELLDLSF